MNKPVTIEGLLDELDNEVVSFTLASLDKSMYADSLLHRSKADALKTKIASYYVSRPHGSVLVTQAEHDALLSIYNAAQAIIEQGITSQTIHNLELATEKYTEILEVVE